MNIFPWICWRNAKVVTLANSSFCSHLFYCWEVYQKGTLALNTSSLKYQISLREEIDKDILNNQSWCHSQMILLRKVNCRVSLKEALVKYCCLIVSETRVTVNSHHYKFESCKKGMHPSLHFIQCPLSNILTAFLLTVIDVDTPYAYHHNNANGCKEWTQKF